MSLVHPQIRSKISSRVHASISRQPIVYKHQHFMIGRNNSLHSQSSFADSASSTPSDAGRLQCSDNQSIDGSDAFEALLALASAARNDDQNNNEKTSNINDNNNTENIKSHSETTSIASTTTNVTSSTTSSPKLTSNRKRKSSTDLTSNKQSMKREVITSETNDKHRRRREKELVQPQRSILKPQFSNSVNPTLVAAPVAISTLRSSSSTFTDVTRSMHYPRASVSDYGVPSSSQRSSYFRNCSRHVFTTYHIFYNERKRFLDSMSIPLEARHPNIYSPHLSRSQLYQIIHQLRHEIAIIQQTYIIQQQQRSQQQHLQFKHQIQQPRLNVSPIVTVKNKT